MIKVHNPPFCNSGEREGCTNSVVLLKSSLSTISTTSRKKLIEFAILCRIRNVKRMMHHKEMQQRHQYSFDMFEYFQNHTGMYTGNIIMGFVKKKTSNLLKILMNKEHCTQLGPIYAYTRGT